MFMNFSDKLKLWPNKQSLCFLVLTRFDFTPMGWSETGPSFGPVGWFQVPVHLFSVWSSETLNVKKDLEKNAEIREGQSISQSLLPFKVSPWSFFGLNSQFIHVSTTFNFTCNTWSSKNVVSTPDETKRWRCLEHKDAQTGQNSKRQFEFSPTNSKIWYARFFISLGEMVSRQIIIILIIIVWTLTIETNESGFCTIPYLQLLGHFN